MLLVIADDEIRDFLQLRHSIFHRQTQAGIAHHLRIVGAVAYRNGQFIGEAQKMCQLPHSLALTCLTAINLQIIGVRLDHDQLRVIGEQFLAFEQRIVVGEKGTDHLEAVQPVDKFFVIVHDLIGCPEKIHPTTSHMHPGIDLVLFHSPVKIRIHIVVEHQAHIVLVKLVQEPLCGFLGDLFLPNDSAFLFIVDHSAVRGDVVADLGIFPDLCRHFPPGSAGSRYKEDILRLQLGNGFPVFTGNLLVAVKKGTVQVADHHLIPGGCLQFFRQDLHDLQAV